MLLLSDILQYVSNPYSSRTGSAKISSIGFMYSRLIAASPRMLASGTTYRAVVDELRFNEAKNLLENTNERVIDVAGAVGFDDQAHFARMFRRVGGLSPREFRNTLL